MKTVREAIASGEIRTSLGTAATVHSVYTDGTLVYCPPV